uniref:Putative ovule protein n=1 Tax=Solanum chacoense TaxID=4108 RepID=A0A0V0GUM7_SOLCH
MLLLYFLYCPSSSFLCYLVKLGSTLKFFSCGPCGWCVTNRKEDYSKSYFQLVRIFFVFLKRSLLS